MPSNGPEMSEYGFILAPGSENFVELDPRMLTSDEAIYGIEPEQRICFTTNERKLKFFRHYSFINCFRECVSNHTFAVSIMACAQGVRSRRALKNTFFRIVVVLRTICPKMPKCPFAQFQNGIVSLKKLKKWKITLTKY